MVKSTLLKNWKEFFCWQSLSDGCIYYALYSDVEYKILYNHETNQYQPLPSYKYLYRIINGQHLCYKRMKNYLELTDEMIDQLNKFRQEQ